MHPSGGSVPSQSRSHPPPFLTITTWLPSSPRSRGPSRDTSHNGVVGRRYISHMGETAASALKRAEKDRITSPIVILEIGGNDLLGSTSSAEFSVDLDTLLAHVRAPGRQVIMFELPLPPFSHEYGRIQRTLARKHKVSLVPKRILLSVLAANGSTLDTVHLSQAGRDRMARCVWQLVSSALSVKTPAENLERP